MALSLLTLSPEFVTAAEAVRDVAIHGELVRLPVEEVRGLDFRRLSTADGLSQTHVSVIIEDDLGFIWMGTQYGVNRYDGYRFKLYVHEPGNPKSAGGTLVYSMFKDHLGFIWIGWNEGLDRLDPRTETFTHYLVEPEKSDRRVNAIKYISEDRAGMIWLATGSGLHRLDPATGTLTHFRADQKPGGLPTNDVTWSGEDSRGRFWVGTGMGLLEFDRARGKVLRFISMSDDIRVRLFEDRDGRYWITQTSGHGLSLFDPETNVVTPYYPSVRALRSWRRVYNADPGPGATTGVTDVAEDSDGNLWLGSLGVGLLRINRERTRLFHYAYQPQDLHSLAENAAIALLPDRDGNLWVGLNSAGVNYAVRGAQRFEVFHNIPGDPNSLTLNFVNAIFEDREGVLWIGNDDGLNRIDRRSGKRDLIELGLGAKPMVISLTQDHEGALWVGTFAQGVTRYDPRTYRYETFRHDPTNQHSLSQNEVHRIHVDRQGTVWVSTDDGLDRFDPVRRQFDTYRVTNGSLGSQSYTGIAEDATGKLWLGTTLFGLHRFDPATGRLTVYEESSYDDNGLRDTLVRDVLLSRSGTLWIGTQNGLNSLDLKSGKMLAFDTRNGMPANPVGCLLEDDRGAIWMSTTRGIAKYTPGTGTFSSYSLFAPLQGADFTGWDACSKGPDGELFFAGFSGALGFSPPALEEDAGAAPLVLTDFDIDGVKAPIGPGAPLTRAIAYSSKVVLQPNQRNFSIRFAGLRYSSPEAIRYRYRLEGMDNDVWQESPSSIRQATYTTLPSGRYIFHAQMATPRGEWQEPGVALQLLILPPWWATWWFRTLCALTLIVLTWLLVRARVQYVARDITLKMEARSDERMRIARDLHDTLLQGLLSASMQLSIVEDEIEPTAKARPLIEYVANLLRQLVQEGRSAVGGLRTMQFESDDLERAIAAIPGDLRIRTTAEFRVVVIGMSRSLLPAIRTEVYLIAREAISNALRHSGAQKIEVSLEYLPEIFKLTVRDDGQGFLAETVSAGRASHFGLSVMKERAERVKGTLQVTSGLAAGTEIALSLPARSAYQPDPINNLR